VSDRFAFQTVDTIQPEDFEATIQVYELCGRAPDAGQG
jgi:hypothetical protein